MPHVIETASTGRARCRGCNGKIDKGELRFGERHPNAFGEGEMTLWFHLPCAAFKRPEPFLEALDVQPDDIPETRALATVAEQGIAHRRLPRINGAERAPTGRARCRSCRQPIERGSWRIPLVFFEEYRFEPSGFVHLGCARDYFETVDILDRIQRFSPDLEPEDLKQIREELEGLDGSRQG